MKIIQLIKFRDAVNFILDNSGKVFIEHFFLFIRNIEKAFECNIEVAI